jgi:hypothetical protein
MSESPTLLPESVPNSVSRYAHLVRTSPYRARPPLAPPCSAFIATMAKAI